VFLINLFFWAITRLLLSFRYRVRVEGKEKLKSLKGPTLVLPNHPALIDPPLVSAHIQLHKPLRPLVNSGTFRTKVLWPLMKMVDAFEVPDLSAHSREASNRALQMIDSVVERIQAGDCMLIYPSGRLQRSNTEVVGAARSVYEIAARCPEANIVLVRTRGLYGSIFSTAESGATPSLPAQVVRAIGWVFASLFFFLPRRKVSLQVEVLDRSKIPMATREEFNAFLESWYNSDGGQEPKFVRFNHLFGPTEGNFGRANALASYDISKIRPKTILLVNDMVQAHIGRVLSEEEQKPETKLEIIGLDSLDRMDLALKIENQFSFRSDVVTDTLGGLWALADGQFAASSNSASKTPEAWLAWQTGPHEKIEDPASLVLADTVAEAFVRRALKSPNQITSADSLSGVLTYRKLLVGAALMARRIEAYPEKHVALMLPASVASDIVYFAMQLAGKIPVMLNWTTGPANLAHAVKVTGVKQILTSRKMIDRLGIEVEGADYVFLEDLKAGIGKLEALTMLAKTYLAPQGFLKRLPKQTDTEPAVFLFTSGSESFPKTVPLTHRNLMCNIRASLRVLQPEPGASLLGFLPPFHSFGLAGNLLLPQLTGIPCVRYADPTDATGLVRTIATYRPSLLFSTPTFLGYILSVCKDDELHSIRRVVAGAEKCPQSVFDGCAEKAPHAVILEGYGITECSPVVSANRIGNSKAGTVGTPVDNVEVCIVDVDQGTRVPSGQTGMLLVSGPSIFEGYYCHEGDSPFVEYEGKNWYRTGDLVSQDSDGFLYFQGRLKRFLKAGGEMISLPALEEPFLKKFPADIDGPKVAVEGVETSDGRHIVLFTTQDLSLREASQILLEAGLRGVMRLDEVRKMEKLPILGTGKTDYKELRKLIVH
jgi:acyl-CoA synthetase (AMP-forming)/AMP-acid ligase II/1-acyl-sn-glycerol-3-phosphate acyltransferase